MSLSTEFCCDKTGDRGGGGGAVAHHRRLIGGLLVWATLLTLGLAASITLHFIQRKSTAPSESQVPTPATQDKASKASKISLMTFKPSADNNPKKKIIKWNTLHAKFIEGEEQLKVKETGLYFLFLQVTLEAQPSENQTIIVQTKNRNVILKGFINGSNTSTGFMGIGIYLESSDTFNVTCEPGAKIKNSPLSTYLGVIQLDQD